MFPGVHVLEVWAQYIDVKKLTFKMRWYQKGSNLIIGLLNWPEADSIWRVGCYESELDLLAPLGYTLFLFSTPSSVRGYLWQQLVSLTPTTAPSISTFQPPTPRSKLFIIKLSIYCCPRNLYPCKIPNILRAPFDFLFVPFSQNIHFLCPYSQCQIHSS